MHARSFVFARTVAASAAIALTTTFGAQTSLAAFELPTSARNAPDSWTRGSSNTTYVDWTGFESAHLGTQDTADAGEGFYNPNGSPNLQQLNAPVGFMPPSIFVSGSGWIYGFSSPLSVSIDVPNYDLGALYETDVVLQLKLYSGVEDMLLLDTLKLNGSLAYDEIEEISRFEGEEMGSDSFQIEYWIKWNNVPGNAANYNLTFQTYTETGVGLDEHTFVQAASVDTSATLIPEPASLGLIAGTAGIALLSRKRRR